MQKISSRENAKLKLARKVRDGREQNLIFVEGVRLAEEILRSNARIIEVLIAENFVKNERAAHLAAAIQSRNLSVGEVSSDIFQSIADTRQTQGIIVISERPATGKAGFEAQFAARKAGLQLVVFLHEINNPSNLGAILRTAEAVDARHVIVSSNSADVFSPKSLRASMGAGLRLNIWAGAGFDEVLKWANNHHLISTAADIKAQKTYLDIDWHKPRLLVFGSEAHGLNTERLQKIDESLMIPMQNQVESLNLAVSCGIILFEAFRHTGRS